MKSYRHLADRWAIYDNITTGFPELIASQHSEELVVHNAETWDLLAEGDEND